MEVDGGHNFRRGIRGSCRCVKIALTSLREEAGRVGRVGQLVKFAKHWTFYRWKQWPSTKVFSFASLYGFSLKKKKEKENEKQKNCQSEAYANINLVVGSLMKQQQL